MYKERNHSMQLSIPHSVYGESIYFISTPIRAWLHEHGFNYSYCGNSQWGNGYTDGVSNVVYEYTVYNINPEDATLFGIHFPDVKIYLSRQCHV